MKTQEVIRHFGSQAAVARALGITSSAVNQWREVVPLATAARLEKITQGALVLDVDQYVKPK
ncbi:MAG TPA: Cro/CI family transcriptional regulator [Candidatus Competibacteraceae bacterium]|nr:Cro/CI family transcriptional regulator [Candidatus Competibacteraceae bacterium]